MSGYGQTQYKRTQVTTVDKGRLIVLLYEGTIKFVHQAKACAEAGDVEGKCNYINRALDVITELNHSLNMTEGGELAMNLRNLYMFMSDHLIKGKINKDGHYLDEVIRILTTLLEAWNEVVSQPEAKKAVPQNESSALKASVKV